MNDKNLYKNIPSNPGVYFFKDKTNQIIYIGKAKNLKKRVSSYFNKKNLNSKNKLMVSKAVKVESLIVKNEVEALITEANLIKIHKPRYNISMKDDKTFPYIMITSEPYPRVEIIRRKNLYKDRNIYFGPYTDIYYLRSVVKIIHQIFPIRTCSYLINKKAIENKKIDVCLDYHIKKCDGPCEGLVTEKDYNNMIAQIIRFLKGKNKYVKIYLNNLMSKASNQFKYEAAARIRDQISSLEQFEKKQTKVTQKFVNRDLITISYKDHYGIGLVMRIRNGLLVGSEKFNLKISSNFIIKDEIDKFIVQYYQITMDFPSEIIINHQIENKSNIEDWLRSKKKSNVTIINPLKGEKKHMLDICIKNNDLLLKELLIKKLKRKEYIPKILSELMNDLNMALLPRRIEAFDNSNIQGSSPVAGMVCFIDGKPSKKDYRKFNIKSVEGIDDFESMREVVYRRYLRLLNENHKLPDLILIDGGKGQLSAAKSSLDKLGLGYITVIGIAKKLEEVYLPGFSEPQNISKTSPSLYLLRRIRDEVHRFAITFHRQKRDKSMYKSTISDIKGIGKKRIQSIWNNYDSLKELSKDSKSNIRNKTGMSDKLIKELLKIIKNKEADE
jgi:excinuclease ABC subunit C